MRQNTVVSKGHYGTFYTENTVASTNVVQPGPKGNQLVLPLPFANQIDKVQMMQSLQDSPNLCSHSIIHTVLITLKGEERCRSGY